MDSAFQIVAITDRSAPNGGPEMLVYAATTETEEDAIALAKAELPPAWQIKVIYGFKYGPAFVQDHGRVANELWRVP